MKNVQWLCNAGMGAGEIRQIKRAFEMYRDVDAEKLFDNLVYFLEAIGPVCEKYDIKMGIHPDDPAWPILVSQEL